MFFILISLVLNLNVYADGAKCTILVSSEDQANVPSSTIKLEEVEGTDSFDSFKITSTKDNEGVLIIDLSESGKISAAAGIPEETIAEVNAAYNYNYGNGYITQTISQTGQGTFHPNKKGTFKIEVDKATKCSEQDISLLLFLIDKWFYV